MGSAELSFVRATRCFRDPRARSGRCSLRGRPGSAALLLGTPLIDPDVGAVAAWGRDEPLRASGWALPDARLCGVTAPLLGPLTGDICERGGGESGDRPLSVRPSSTRASHEDQPGIGGASCVRSELCPHQGI
eukprot:4017666-Alexandrium_andersonii.AAC.1